MPTSAFELSRNPTTSKTSLKLIRSLDYEQDQRYVMTVRVTAGEEDRGGVSFSTLLTVIVEVKDSNDITPKILSSDKITIDSDVKLNVPVMKVIAADEDSGDAGRISYSLIGGNEEDAFEVNYQHFLFSGFLYFMNYFLYGTIFLLILHYKHTLLIVK